MPSLKKKTSKILKPSTWRGLLCFRDSKITLFQQNIILPPKKFLVCLNQCNVIEKNQLLFLYVFFYLKATELLRVEAQNWSKIK